MEIPMTFDNDGTVHCLYHEAIPLHELGELSVRRASHIEFDEEMQVWLVLSADKSQVLYQAISRMLCLDWEIRNLKAC